MKLNKLKTPYERRRVIQYSVDGNTEVCRWRNVRHVVGPVYMSEIAEDSFGDQVFDLFLFFPDVEAGMFWVDSTHPEWCTPKSLDKLSKRYSVDRKDALIARLDDRMMKDYHISNVEIAFVRQWAPDKAEIYRRYKAQRLARQSREEYKRRMEEEAEIAREDAEEEARIEAEKAKYLGWADEMSPMQFGKVDAKEAGQRDKLVWEQMGSKEEQAPD